LKILDRIFSMESSLNNILLAVIISLLLLNLFGINTSNNWFWITFIIGIIISTIIKSFYWYKRQNYFLKEGGLSGPPFF
jgi:phosphoglycerol transferase MdoB-like AlkP superfamily enzyme